MVCRECEFNFVILVSSPSIVLRIPQLFCHCVKQHCSGIWYAYLGEIQGILAISKFSVPDSSGCITNLLEKGNVVVMWPYTVLFTNHMTFSPSSESQLSWRLDLYRDCCVCWSNRSPLALKKYSQIVSLYTFPCIYSQLSRNRDFVVPVMDHATFLLMCMPWV